MEMKIIALQFDENLILKEKSTILITIEQQLCCSDCLTDYCVTTTHNFALFKCHFMH